MVICSPDKLSLELEFITSTLMENGYPEGVISRITSNLLNAKTDSNIASKEKPSVFLRLPYIGTVSTTYKRRVIDAVTSCYDNVLPRVMLTSRPMLTSAPKDVLPTLSRSNLVYEFTCHCDSRYVGKTTQRLLSRVKEHVPVYVRNNTRPEKMPSSAIGRHLRDNDDCRVHFTNDRFSILGFGRNDFHLAVLESLFIIEKRPILCVQKKFVYTTLLFWLASNCHCIRTPNFHLLISCPNFRPRSYVVCFSDLVLLIENYVRRYY